MIRCLNIYMNSNLPLIAVVGQPNAGKSTLVNKIAGKPFAITSEVAGTTRDRQYIDTTWNGIDFTMVDTAGLSLEITEGLELSLIKQIEIALAEADIVILVVDGKEPVGAFSDISMKKFRGAKKPLILAVNKLDSPKTREEKVGEFSRLGIKPSFGVSSISGLGLGDLLDEVTEQIKKLGLDVIPEEKTVGIAVSIVGKPNVGKSSIFNAILKEERVVVSPIAGTTRTAIDSKINIKGEDYTFIDTAGLKKKEYRQAQPDVFAGFQTFKAIRRSDVCFFVIDANAEITKQDQKVAGEILNMERGCIILANKSDLMPKDKVEETKVKKNSTLSESKASSDEYKTMRDYISHHFPFLWMCPLIFVSALDGTGLEEALDAIKPIYEARHKMISDEDAADFLKNALKINPPKLLRDQREPKVFTLKQVDTNTPLFELYVNYPAAISTQFRRFIEKSIMQHLGFWGTPINVRLRGKDKS
jgi:GTP-binding protein